MGRTFGHAIVTVVFLMVGLRGTVAADEAAFQGKTVVVKADANALIIWDATPEIIMIVHEKLSDDAANERLKRHGLRALASELKSLSTSSATITLRIIYAKTGDVNPAYKAVTFTGVERYANISMIGKDAFTKRDSWTALKPDGPVPPWVQYKITGELPPR